MDKIKIKPDDLRDHAIRKKTEKIKNMQKTGFHDSRIKFENEMITEDLDKIMGNKNKPKKGISDLTKAGIAAAGTAGGSFGLMALAKGMGSPLGEKIAHNMEKIMGDH
jgi:hypothetical protein